MRRFLSSAWFGFLVCLVLAGATAGAFAVLAPSGDGIGNYQIAHISAMAGWAIGPVAGLLSLILIGILNLLRRIVRLRNAAILDPVTVLAGVVPWVIFSWQLAGEPRFTPIARAVIDFAARPLLWGSLVACAFVFLLSLGLFLPSSQK